jgi:hypothetical protein
MQTLIRLTVISILLVALVSSGSTNQVASVAQTRTELLFSCGYSEGNHGEQFCNYVQSLRFGPNQRAEQVVDKIVTFSGLKRNFVLLPCPNINNAVAVTLLDWNRYIVYDNDFMETIDRGANTDWASVSVLAHEVGHHLNGHTTVPFGVQGPAESLEKRRQQELEADEFSGFVMLKFGRSLHEAQAAMKHARDVEDERTSTHPKNERRLAAIKKGYESAQSQDRGGPAYEAWTVIGRNEIVSGRNYPGSFGYIYRGGGVNRTEPDYSEQQHRSKLVVLENGKPLPIPHSMHAHIQGMGTGRYSHWFDGRETYLWFSTSDNSDPRTNGRVYAVTVPRQ